MTRTKLVRSTHSLRCPGCGQPIQTPDASRCTLCGLDLGDDRATGADATPFAKAYQLGEPGWRRMCEWVWYAGAGRLKHVALMRASAASRRFARCTALLLGVGCAILQFTDTGWRMVAGSAAVEATGSTTPRGHGWYHAAAASPAARVTRAAEAPVDLWWNPAQSVIAATSGYVGSLLLLLLAIRFFTWAVVRAHGEPYRAEQRLGAAVHYSLAWGVPAMLAAVVLALRPLVHVGRIHRWTWCPTDVGVAVAAGAAAGTAAGLWWFWLVRAASTSPKRTRARVVAFAAIGAPAVVAGVGAGWWVAMRWAMDRLFAELGLGF